MLPADATDLLWLRSLPVLSQWNLSAFLHWAQSAEEPLLIDVLGRISLPEHRCDFGGPSRPITIRGHVLSPSPCTRSLHSWGRRLPVQVDFPTLDCQGFH